MGIERLLAKLTPGTIDPKGGAGGVPSITTDELNGALGFAQKELIKRESQNQPIRPEVPLGILLVQAKWLEDEGSLRLLELRLPRQVWLAWWDHEGVNDEELSRLHIKRLGEVLAQEYTRANPAKALSQGKIAHEVGVNWRTWKRKFSRIYGQQVKELSVIEGNALSLVRKQLFERFH